MNVFRNWVLQNFPYIEDDFDALTDYELFCKICGYVIEYSKDNEEMKQQIADFQNYFDNLDVQEEINNKLDEMASDGTLDEIINQNIFNELDGKVDQNTHDIGQNTIDIEKNTHDIEQINDEIEEMTDNILSDDCQTLLYKELNGLFEYSSGWALSSCLIIDNKGIAVANDWTEGGSGGTKFNIVTFDYISETISNIVTRYELVTGHANSMCKIDDENVLIAGMSNSYIYNLTTNTYEETDVISGLSACGDYNGDIYGSIPAQNKLYKLIYEDDTLSIDEEYTIDGLYSTLNYGGQGMVIYDNKIIYPGHTPVCLVMVDLDTKKIIKNQLITAPYNSEYEDGFVYNNELLLCDAVGRLFKPDIYGKRNIGGYSGFIITKSLTDIVLYNEPKRLNLNADNIINFEKYMSFLNINSNSDIGTIGSQFESITLYLGHGTAGSTKMHELTPCEITCFKGVSNMGLKNNTNSSVTSYDCQFNGSYYNMYNNELEKYTVSGIVTFAGGDSVPNINIRLNRFIEFMNINDGTIDAIDTTSSEQNVYLIKIVGHKKVGYGY